MTPWRRASSTHCVCLCLSGNKESLGLLPNSSHQSLPKRDFRKKGFSFGNCALSIVVFQDSALSEKIKHCNVTISFEVRKAQMEHVNNLVIS